MLLPASLILFSMIMGPLEFDWGDQLNCNLSQFPSISSNRRCWRLNENMPHCLNQAYALWKRQTAKHNIVNAEKIWFLRCPNTKSYSCIWIYRWATGIMCGHIFEGPQYLAVKAVWSYEWNNCITRSRNTEFFAISREKFSGVCKHHQTKTRRAKE